ncbi:MAG: fatty acid--CoA ligase family protein [Actinomycetota bacterium]|nr:fatty acid--CoA ligase family protein [Actinomycetota bacterium]
MPRLVAVVAEGGSGFVDALQRAWDAGDAVAPLDPRLPPPAAEALLDALAPSQVVAPDGVAFPRRGGRPVEHGDALVVATSGTSGSPRGVVLTVQAVRAAALATSAALAVDPGRDRWLACLPLAHVGGLSVVTRALLTGTPLALLPAADPAGIHAEARRGATLVSLVPTLLGRVDVSAFRRVLLGGAAPPAERPPNVVATYGMTETCGGVVHDGRPLPGVEVRAVDGELHVRGPMLLRCYRDGADPKDARGWLATGDGGEVGADGEVRVAGRLAEVVVTGGEKVWPAPVEAVLAGHEAVAEVAVAGRPDPEWGQRVVAFVVPAHHAAPPSLESLRGWAKQRLPAYAAPRELVLVETLPRTALGKLRRAELAAFARPGATLGSVDG